MTAHLALSCHRCISSGQTGRGDPAPSTPLTVCPRGSCLSSLSLSSLIRKLKIILRPPWKGWEGWLRLGDGSQHTPLGFCESGRQYRCAFHSSVFASEKSSESPQRSLPSKQRLQPDSRTAGQQGLPGEA